MSRDLVLNDRYRLVQPVATGGMGEVWTARDERTGRDVAVKLLREDVPPDVAAPERFAAEARCAEVLRHEGIARVYDHGTHSGRAYLVMELVPGEPLSAVLARVGRLTAWRTLDLVAQTARALAAAHRAGIVHRDVKPGNLLVTADGTVKITDFGIARGPESAGVTAAGRVMGSVRYLSPEQATGQELTPAVDLYALGVVAFECLAGRVPFDGDTTVDTALKHVREAPPRLPDDVPADVQALVFTLLAKEPAERFGGDAGRVAERAAALRDALPPPVPPGAAPVTAPEPRPGISDNQHDSPRRPRGSPEFVRGSPRFPRGSPGRPGDPQRAPGTPTESPELDDSFTPGNLRVGDMPEQGRTAPAHRSRAGAPIREPGRPGGLDLRGSAPAGPGARGLRPVGLASARPVRDDREPRPGPRATTPYRSASPSTEADHRSDRDRPRPEASTRTDGEDHDSVNSEPGSLARPPRGARF
ncbi:putative serine/threonine-protein kinase PknA [Actinomadura sp. NBRC 104425]|uniref:serine/threonine-protein kinase n=1 Tax=Actinomadura sp. NBRC 104425 TaxID=3032204 RepID=UPI0024A07EA5|nr:serine/threonine protein kinase [Actinomadura sp. NBRC 104425]GLZ12608.1 putative serine/threonine-protein kinase PknA [Actinomadura sp. NBRC 104425]